MQNIRSLYLIIFSILCLCELAFANPQNTPKAKGLQEKMRGVNLGGWLLIEPWIVQDWFNQYCNGCPDEWTLSQTLRNKRGLAGAQKIMSQHWSSFVSEAEIKELASYGINWARIPFGYWLVDIQAGEPYIPGGLPYLQRVIGWCKKYNIKVLLDFHGAPGSQQGSMNSGHQTTAEFLSGGFEGANVQRALKVIGKVASIFSTPSYKSVVRGFDLLNEPKPSNWTAYQEFLVAGYHSVRKAESANNKKYKIVGAESMMVSSMYDPGLLSGPGFNNTMNDVHIYTGYNGKSPSDHITETCASGPGLSNTTTPSYVGEWTLATGTMANTPSNFDYAAWALKWTSAQMDAYEKGAGWIYWNFKVINDTPWSYLYGVRAGYIPKNPSNRPFKCPK